MLRLEPRARQSLWAAWLSPVLAIAMTMVTGTAIFIVMGKDPAATLYIYFLQPLVSASGLSEVAVKAGPLVLIAIGLSFGFRANVWNIGAEGQYVLGAIVGGGLAVFFHDSTSPLLLPSMLVFGIAGGALWAAVPALLKTRFKRERDSRFADARLRCRTTAGLSRSWSMAKSPGVWLSGYTHVSGGCRAAGVFRRAPSSLGSSRRAFRALSGVVPGRKNPFSAFESVCSVRRRSPRATPA